MINVDKKLFKLIIVFLTMFSVTGCAGVKAWPEQKGRVLEVGTNKPIEGAIVVALWNGRRNMAFVDSQSTCYHVETATTDAQGNYTIPSRFDGVMQSQVFDKSIDIHVYKTGYVVAEKTYKEETYKKNIYFIELFKGPKKKRFEYLKSINVTCVNSGSSQKNVLLIMKAIYSEMHALASTSNENRIVELMLWAIEELELGAEIANKRHYGRLGVSR